MFSAITFNAFAIFITSLISDFSMTHHFNPFFFESPAARQAFTDREELAARLVAFMRQRGRRMLVHGLRRMGKTSLILNAGRISKENLVFVDVSTATNLNEVARNLLLAAPREEESLLLKLFRLAQKHFSSVTLGAGGIQLTGELRPDEGPKNLQSVLTYLNDRAGAEDKPLTICLDEFQDLRLLGGERIDWQIRGIIQHFENVNFIFAGSDYRLVKWMTEPNAAFFNQLQMMEVGPIDTSLLVKWMAGRAKIGGLAAFPFGQDIVEMAGPRTGDIIRLAMSCFELAAAGETPAGQVAAKAFDLVTFSEKTYEFSSRWHDCSLVQRAVLRAIALGFAPTAAETVRKFELGTTSTAHSALKTLLKRQILTRDIEGEIKFDSPFFSHWCATQGARP